jgi:hypothetical protein
VRRFILFNPKTGRGDFSFIDSFAHWLFRGKRGRILFLLIAIGVIVAMCTGNSERNSNQSQSTNVQAESTQ